MENEEEKLSGCLRMAVTVDSIERLIGVEGIAAKTYFSALSRLTNPVFRFAGRSRNPPRDPF
jgi:CRISPR-associated protein Cas1